MAKATKAIAITFAANNAKPSRLMPFTRKLSAPIILSDGRTLSTLADVVKLMETLPELHLRNEHWDIAAKAIQDAADGGDIGKAERAIRVALYWERLLQDREK